MTHVRFVAGLATIAFLSSQAHGARAQRWKEMDYGPRLTTSLEVGNGNFAWGCPGSCLGSPMLQLAAFGRSRADRSLAAVVEQ